MQHPLASRSKQNYLLTISTSFIEIFSFFIHHFLIISTEISSGFSRKLLDINPRHQFVRSALPILPHLDGKYEKKALPFYTKQTTSLFFLLQSWLFRLDFVTFSFFFDYFAWWNNCSLTTESFFFLNPFFIV